MAMVDLNAQVIEQDGRKLFAVLPWAQYERLRELLEDAADLRDLEAAMRANEGDRPVRYEDARRDLGLASDRQP